jgi:hypothetical protein
VVNVRRSKRERGDDSRTVDSWMVEEGIGGLETIGVT